MLEMVLQYENWNYKISLCANSFKSEKTHALIPCGHTVLCGVRVELLDPKHCPICNDYLTSVSAYLVLTYLPI